MRTPSTALERQRLLHGFSRVDLGKRAGVHPLTIFRIEHHGLACAQIGTLTRLAVALDVPLATLLP